MTEEAKTEETQQAVQPVSETTDEQQNKQDDLLSRVSKFQENNASDDDSSDKGGNILPLKDLDETIAKIEDSDMRSKYERLRKDLVSGANNKYQEIATLRKEMQSFMEGNKNGGAWTPERVQQLANDPEFVKAAQQVAQVSDSDPDDPLEYLDEGTKKYVKGLEAKISKLENATNQAWENQNKALREQQHRELQGKYGDYNPQKIDEITKEMLEGKIQATNEHIYKAFNYDTAVNKAYELGRKDEREGVQTKIQSSSVDGLQTVQPNMKIEPEKGESSKSFFNRIIDKNLKLAKAKG